MEDPTTLWLVAEAVKGSKRPSLWAWAGLAAGVAVVVASGILFGGGDEPGVVLGPGSGCVSAVESAR